MAFFMDPAMLGNGPSIPQGTSSSLIKALLAKHGTVDPSVSAAPKTPLPGPASPGPVMAGPDLKSDLPVALAGAPAPMLSGPGIADVASSLPTGNIKQPGMLDRIGDFLKSDEGRAALLRSGAATLQGGLGAGINAGASFVDQRRAEAAASAEHAAEMAMRGHQIDNNYNLGLGRLDIDAAGTEETGRHNRAGEGIDRSRIMSDLHKHDTPSGDTRARTAEDRFEHITPSGNTQLTETGQNYRHDSVSGDTAATQAGETARNTQDNQTTLMRDRIGAAPKTTMHAHYTTTPEEFARTGPRLRAPSEVKPAGDQGVVSVASDADYAALASGTKFKGPDGQVRVKP